METSSFLPTHLFLRLLCWHDDLVLTVSWEGVKGVLFSIGEYPYLFILNQYHSNRGFSLFFSGHGIVCFLSRLNDHGGEPF
jgi:hypothetical protein